MNLSEAKAKLQSINQTHLLAEWHSLSHEMQEKLLKQIEQLNCDVFKKQQELIALGFNPVTGTMQPFTDYDYSGNVINKEHGLNLIRQGKVGCLLIAGGLGTRLGCNGPKGVIPVTPIKHKSLFQLFAEKTLAAGKQAGQTLHMAIMTSPQNDVETRSFFQNHSNFGLNPNQLHFFSQGTLPFLDENKNLFLENDSQIAHGPDGNGSSLYHFVQSDLWKQWKAHGIEYVTFILVDNALADPFDAELVGYHAHQQDDVTIKCVKKRDAEEKVGVLVRYNNQIHVQEYLEMPSEECYAINDNGSLKHICANISQFCFHMPFIQKCAKMDMPLHSNLKTKVWKFERFIFDVLSNTQKVHALLYPREVCFSPLKNSFGKDSLQTVQDDLQARDRIILQEITHKTLPNYPFELAQDFYYPTTELLTKWKNHLITSQLNYIEDNN